MEIVKLQAKVLRSSSRDCWWELIKKIPFALVKTFYLRWADSAEQTERKTIQCNAMEWR